MTGYKVQTPPATEPVTLAEAKAHLRLEHTADDTYISGLITSARELLERQTNRAFVTQTIIEVREVWPGACGWNPIKSPVQSITAIRYYDFDGTLQTMPSTDYVAGIVASPAVVRPAYGKSWPSAQSGRPEAVQMEYVAGFGNAAAVPQRAKQAICLLVAHWYERREPVVSGNTTDLPFALQTLISNLRVMRF